MGIREKNFDDRIERKTILPINLTNNGGMLSENSAQASWYDKNP